MQRQFYTLLITLASMTSAMAQVVDFEDIGVRPGTNNPGGDRTSGGFFFDSAINRTHISNRFSAPDNGSSFLALTDLQGVNTIVMTQLNGRDFGLATVDLTQRRSRLGGAFGNRTLEAATDVMFTGFYSAGGSVQQIIDIAAPEHAWATHRFPGNWTGLTRVEFHGIGTPSENAYAIDNIRWVPEPASIALMLGGLAGIAAGRRRTR